MSRISGITKEKDYKGITRYIRIDMRKYGDNETLQDFLDVQDANARSSEESIPFSDFVEKENKRRKI